MKRAAWKNCSKFEVPRQSPGFLLWQVSTNWRRSIETALKNVCLTHAQFVLLANLEWLHRDNKKVSQVALAAQCKTDVAMTSQILRALEKRGYVQRVALDERSKCAIITQKGVQLVEQAIVLVEEADSCFFQALGTDESVFVSFLQKIVKE